MIKIINKKKTYSAYVSHQKSKIKKFLSSPKLSLSRVNFFFYDKMFFNALVNRLETHPHLNPHSSVLCLGARMGTEVRAFIHRGHFAVGVDLEPSLYNKYVVTGDFHKLQFADSSLDVVYCNSFDHSLKPFRFISEVKRVLKPDGLLILELCRGTNEGYTPGEFECLTWQKTVDVVRLFAERGLNEINASFSKIPFELTSITFRKEVLK